MYSINKNNQVRFSFALCRYFTLFVFIQILLSVPSAHAGKVLTIDNDRQFAYAMQLLSEGEYASAICEFNRFIHFFPDDKRVGLAHYNIGQSFFSQKKYRDAIGSFTTCAADTESSVDSKAAFMISQCHLKLDQPGPAIICLRNLAAGTQDIDILDKTYFNLGWIYLDRADWIKARDNFNKISRANADRYNLAKLTASIDQHHSIARKSPKLAGWLSILPGAGQLYCGRYHDALVAFLINGGLIWASCEAFDKDLNALGAVLSIAEAGYYSGNIYSAVNSAHKYNRSKNRTFIEDIRRNTRVNLSAMPGEKGVVLSLHYRF